MKGLLASLRTRKRVSALCIVSGLYGWSLLTALGVFGAGPLPTAGAAASAQQYQYSSGHVTGGGQVRDITFAFEATGDTSGVRGTCNVIDQKPKNQIKCRTVTSLVVVGTHATFTGEATHNGVVTTYTIEIDDLSESGIGADRFSITTGTGFSRSGVLTQGNVQTH